MAYFDQAERARIAQAVTAAKRQTCGEIVAVIARQSDDYRLVPLLWAATGALILPLPLLALSPAIAAHQLYEIQVLTFFALALLFLWPPLKMRLIPKAVKRARAGRLARAQFVEQGLHHAEGRSGVMIFVSMAERYVEIMADQGISERVPPDTWQQIVRVFVRKVRAQRLADAFEGAIGSCGALLALHFPRSEEGTQAAAVKLVEL